MNAVEALPSAGNLIILYIYLRTVYDLRVFYLLVESFMLPMDQSSICNSCLLPVYPAAEFSPTFAKQGVLKFNCGHMGHTLCHSKKVKVLSTELKNEVLCPLCEKITDFIREYPISDLEKNPGEFSSVYLKPFFKTQDQLNIFLTLNKYSSLFLDEDLYEDKNLYSAKELCKEDYSPLIAEIYDSYMKRPDGVYRQMAMERMRNSPLLKAIEKNNLDEALKIIDSIEPRKLCTDPYAKHATYQGKFSDVVEWLSQKTPEEQSIFLDTRLIATKAVREPPGSTAEVVLQRIYAIVQEWNSSFREPPGVAVALQKINTIVQELNSSLKNPLGLYSKEFMRKELNSNFIDKDDQHKNSIMSKKSEKESTPLHGERRGSDDSLGIFMEKANERLNESPLLKAIKQYNSVLALEIVDSIDPKEFIVSREMSQAQGQLDFSKILEILSHTTSDYQNHFIDLQIIVTEVYRNPLPITLAVIQRIKERCDAYEKQQLSKQMAITST